MPAILPYIKLTRPRSDSAMLYGAALFVLVWEGARAVVQSITIDEANTWLGSVARPWPSHWVPSANNHVLNSMLMRLAVALFGASHLTLRAPALLGAVIYVASALALVKAVAASPFERLALFLCLAANPFVLDFLVAARGYSLALAFLLAAVAIAAVPRLRAPAEGAPADRRSMAASLCLGLSFAANFSFGLVDACAAILLCAWALWDDERPRNASSAVRTVAVCGAPALAAALFFGAPALLHMPT